MRRKRFSRVPNDLVAVVIPCHNYGRYLGECLDSVLKQSLLPNEILVVDDASSDDTGATARKYISAGVRYLRVEFGNVYMARREGYRATSSPFLCFLDADDMLGRDYLEKAVVALKDESAGIAFSSLLVFGDQHATRHFRPLNIECHNYIHAGSVCRRVALDTARAFDGATPATPSHADWFIWRKVLRYGWTAVSSGGLYHYRKHSQSMMHTRPRNESFFDRASLTHEIVSLVLPLSGREQWWHRLRNWVETQSWPLAQLDVIVADSSDAGFGDGIRRWLTALPVRASTYRRLEVTGSLADADRVNSGSTRKAVASLMPRIYQAALSHATTEYLMIVEDDILPPTDAIPRLMRQMDADVVAVGGAYRSRFGPGFVVWPPRNRRRQGVERVTRTGFGCLLTRRSVMRETVLHHGGQTTWFDWNYGDWCSARHWKWLYDWNVLCSHQHLTPDDCTFMARQRIESTDKTEGRRSSATQRIQRKNAPSRIESLLQHYPCSYRGQLVCFERCHQIHSMRGEDVPVYGCEVHGECSLAPWKSGQRMPACTRCRFRVDPNLRRIRPQKRKVIQSPSPSCVDGE